MKTHKINCHDVKRSYLEWTLYRLYRDNKTTESNVQWPDATVVSQVTGHRLGQLGSLETLLMEFDVETDADSPIASKTFDQLHRFRQAGLSRVGSLNTHSGDGHLS
jgi:hypothetical protein